MVTSARRPRVACVIAGFILVSRRLVDFRAFAPGAGSSSSRIFRTSLSRVSRYAEEQPGVMEVPEMEKAPVYTTVVDVMSGELDVDMLPEEMGVYAVYNEENNLQYIGLSRQIQKSVEAHAKAIGIQEVGSFISSVKCAEMPGQSKELLKETWEKWIKSHMDSGGEIPMGNLPENAPGADPRWRNRGPPAKPPLNLGGIGGITTPMEALDAVTNAIKEHPVVLFMKGSPAMPQCGFSARSVGLLKEIGMPFESVDVLDDQNNPGVRDAVKDFGKWPTIPQLYVKGELMGGADIIREMAETGQLKTVMNEAISGKKSPASSGMAASDGGAEFSPRGPISLINDGRRPTATALCKALDQNFKLLDLRVQDDSAAHEGDAGALEMGLTSESHFSVEIVAPDFEGMMPVQRQKKVYDALSDVMPRIHALSLVTRTPAEEQFAMSRSQ